MKRFILIIILFYVYVLIQGCCDPNKPVVTISPYYYSQNIDLKGFDCDCDADIDYWQHYIGKEEFGSRKYLKKGYEIKCEKK